MGYVGNQQTEGYSQVPAKQDLTGATGTSLTLTHAVASAEGIDLFINNVRQESGEAYSIGGDGVTVTLTGSVVATDDIYVVYNSLARQTSTHPSNQALQATSGTFSGDLNVDTNTLYVDSTNNRVGIGTSSPSYNVDIQDSSTPVMRLKRGTTDTDLRVAAYGVNTGGLIGTYTNSPFLIYTNSAEAMRIDSSGNVLVGTTSVGFTDTGAELRATGQASFTVDGNACAYMNRLTSDGGVLEFSKDGSTVGSIGVGNASSYTYIGTGDTGLMFNSGSNFIQPWNTSTNGGRDNAIDLGNSGNRFDDVFATNGTIQTSDANEKQQIAALTDAEITAAKAISALFKTYKWNSAVTEKGDAARTHAGVIAQDVQAAMTAAVLDAGDYAFFISSTWWETQTEVPAVEAVDAVLDEDGNVVTEAVEAVAAYTRTDTYDTAEEAPEGATERTRLGIRYPELLAFVGAATEQRLANIETRLAALEAN